MGTHAGGYATLIAAGRYEDAYRLVRKTNPFASVCGRVCANPCETVCRRAVVDAPVRIRALKRFVNEHCGVESPHSFEWIRSIIESPRPPVEQPGRVAILGAGPAGLACAHDLALMGHAVTVYEASPFAGGMMRLGIPEYRLPRTVLGAEIDFIRHLGVEIIVGVEVGRDMDFEELCANHDAVFIAVGCRRDAQLSLPGASLNGVLTAVDFLAHVNIGIPVDVGERVVILGGGNVAYDVARTVRRFDDGLRTDDTRHRLAFEVAMVAARVLRREVTIVAPELPDEMGADPRMVEAGKEEGVKVIHRRAATEIVGGNGRVARLQLGRVERVSRVGRRTELQLEEGPGDELLCDTVISAIGQVADISFLGRGHGLGLGEGGTIEVDPTTLATARPGVYAGGDIAFGPRILIEAVSDGIRAARAIDTHLTGRSDPKPRPIVRRLPVTGHNDLFSRGDYERQGRQHIPVLPVASRTASAEVERVLSESDARAEGSRCLHCWVDTVFDSAAERGSECVQCRACVDVCPEQCLSFRTFASIGLKGDRVALVKDEAACVRCGLCARRCPTGVITMRAFYRQGEESLISVVDQSR